MGNSILLPEGSVLLTSRLNALLAGIRSLSLSTRDEYQAEVMNRLNRVLTLGNGMTPLAPITGETPALADQIFANLSSLNQDAQSVVAQLLSTENEAGNLYNLFAAAQNAARQQVREIVYLSTRRRYQEVFINPKQLDSSGTAYLDFASGVAMLPLLSDVPVTASGVVLGTTCAGNIAVPAGSTEAAELGHLIDGSSETRLVWNGSRLDLIVTFAPPVILNHFTLQLDEFEGIELNSLTASPDGITAVDLLANTAEADRSIEGSSGKFSGQFSLNFDGQYVSTLRAVFDAVTGNAVLAIRKLLFSQRGYAPTAVIQSNPISSPASGTMQFLTTEETTPGLTSMTHQISWDGVQYSAIQPGNDIAVVSSPFWYRGTLERLDANFTARSAPIAVPGTDPALTDYYILQSVTTIALGNNIIQRTIVINLNPASGGTRPLLIRETPLPGTLVLRWGSGLLDTSKYNVSGTTINFPTNEVMTGVSISYQTSALANSGLANRKQNFSPRLHQFSFQKV